jgi:hypothetical protein
MSHKVSSKVKDNDRCISKIRFRTRSCGWVVVTAIALVGCGHAEEPPARGKIKVIFEGTSDSDARASEASFTIANGVDRTISIRGFRAPSAIRMSGSDAAITCAPADDSSLSEVTNSLGYGGNDVVDVSPGKRLKIVVTTRPLKEFIGGRCTLKLALTNGAILQSEFQL